MRIATIIILCSAVACGPSTLPDAFVADVIYRDGQILTLDDDRSSAEAVAVRDGRILGVGTSADMMMFAGDATEIVDLDDKTVIPGFYDCHVHPVMGSSDPPLELSKMPDWEAAKAELARHAEAKSADATNQGWIRGNVHELWFDENNPPTFWYDDDNLPTRRDLDEAVSDRPVVLDRSNVLIVNSEALRRAGITSSTVDPEGGLIERDSRGEPNGILRETPATALVRSVMPPPPPRPDDETARQNLKAFFENLLPLGITSLNVAAWSAENWRVLQDVSERWRGELPRFAVQFHPGNSLTPEGGDEIIRKIETFPGHTGFGDEWFKTSAIKVMLDGGFTLRAWSWNTFPHKRRPNFYGLLRMSEENMRRVTKRGHEIGWQFGVHAIGDAAVESTVDALVQAIQANPREDHRHYLHHLTILPRPETLQAMVDNRIGLCSQPNFTLTLHPWYAASLGDEHLEYNNPQQTIRNAGIRLAYGADERPYGPLLGIYAAVTRKGPDGEVYGEEERVAVQDALRSYTYDSAWLNFDEHERGTLSVGKVADMVVLGEDIFSVEPDRLRDIQVLKTIIGGKVVYEAP